MQVVDVNVTQDIYNFCPGTWRMITSPKKLCVGGVNAGCDSAVFNTRGVTFQHICGQTNANPTKRNGQMHLVQAKQLMKYMLMEYLSH